MKIKNILELLTVLIITTGCYGPIKGKVVDAETGAPIEGAVAMAEWTRTKGLGNTYTVSAKVVEAVTDKDGNFELGGCYSPFVNEPLLTIYKNGYVAWSSELIFPALESREGFEWKNGQVFGMEKFKNSYSYVGHKSFIRRAIRSSLGSGKKELLIREYEKNELEKVIEERKEGR